MTCFFKILAITTIDCAMPKCYNIVGYSTNFSLKLVYTKII